MVIFDVLDFWSLVVGFTLGVFCTLAVCVIERTHASSNRGRK